MHKYDCIFFDRDGTVNYDPGYISSIKEFKFFEYTINAFSLFKSISNKFIIITNQSGVGRGLIKECDLIEINNHIMNECAKHKIPLIKIYYCSDHPDYASNDRKPNPGMFLKASEEFNLDLSNCLMVGDSIYDIQPANKLGMDSMMVLTGNGKDHYGKLIKKDMPKYCTENILTGAKLLAG
tara:strand:- start:1268 stop:1810 length:543 start_codon:yes stop_codon:yes gene_type:complete